MNDMETNENLKLIQKYHDQAKIKLWFQYHVDQFGRNQGEYKWWLEDGQISFICNYKDGNWHGKHQSWLSDGRRFFIETRHFKKRYHGIKILFNYGK